MFYYYIITRTTRGSSVQSPIALGFAKKEGAPSKVTNVRITNGRGTTTNKIAISWDGASGLNYEVKRFSSKDSTFTAVATVRDGEETTCEDTKGLKPGVFYYYKVLSIVLIRLTKKPDGLQHFLQFLLQKLHMLQIRMKTELTINQLHPLQ